MDVLRCEAWFCERLDLEGKTGLPIGCGACCLSGNRITFSLLFFLLHVEVGKRRILGFRGEGTRDSPLV